MIWFACPTCNASINFADDKAGTQGACPKCGQRVQVPQRLASPPEKTVLDKLSPEVPEREAIPAGGQRPGAPAVVPRTLCPRCRQEVGCPPELAGRSVVCPHCGAMFNLPGGQPVAAPAPITTRPGRAPIEFDEPQPAPKRRERRPEIDEEEEDDRPRRRRRNRDHDDFRPDPGPGPAAILGLIFSCIGFFFGILIPFSCGTSIYIALPTSLGGFIMSLCGRPSAARTLGIVFGAIGLLLSVLVFFALGAVFRIR